MALIADAAPAAGGGNGAGGAAGGGGIPFPFVALILILGLGYVMLFLPERKKQKAFRDQIASLKKNDRVVTIGGIYGIVSNIQRDIDKVTVKVDDQTKIDFTLGAISKVISTEGASDADKSAAK
ncbi:MAG TPA: preprotein translocase subunit YajC [Pirellulales bacterium]|jgi:preprotein translocase subunit YajC|nr:preprotein translocase subunit YajC [Pirellulales bacterium]